MFSNSFSFYYNYSKYSYIEFYNYSISAYFCIKSLFELVFFLSLLIYLNSSYYY